MERVSLVCRSSLTPLFDWMPVGAAAGWKEDVRAPKDTAALLAFFAQFAKDCQGGDVLRVEFERPAGESDRSKQRGAFARPFGHSQLGGGVGVGGLGVGVGGVAGGRGSHGHHHGALAAAGGGGAGGRKRSSLMLQTGGQSLPLHSNTLHQQQMAMAAAAATPMAALSSPSSVAPASSPSAASMASGNGASATSAGSGGASGAQSPMGGAGSGSSNLLARGRMEMFCAQSEQVVVAIFVNPDYDKQGDLVANQILDDFTAQFAAQLESLRIGHPDRVQSYPGGGEEALLDEAMLPLFAGFKTTLEQSGLTRIEPKAATTVAPHLSIANMGGSMGSVVASASSGDSQTNDSLPPPLSSRPTQRRPSQQQQQQQQQAFPPLGSTTPASSFRGATNSAGGASLTGSSGTAAGAGAAGAGTAPGTAMGSVAEYGYGYGFGGSFVGADDYLPSWIADSAHDPSLLLLQDMPPGFDHAFVPPAQPDFSAAQGEGVELSHMPANAGNATASGGAATVPLLGPNGASNRHASSSVSPPAAAAATTLNDVQISLE